MASRTNIGVPLANVFAAGARRWPRVRLSDAQWAEGLAIVGLDTSSDASLRSDELYVTIASGLADPAAIDIAQREYLLPVLGGFAKRYQISSAEVDEGMLRLNEKLWVGGTVRRPGVFEYQGIGAFGVWLHVVVHRDLISAFRRARTQHAHARSDDVAQHMIDAQFPATQLMSLEAQALVKDAYTRAVSALEPRQRLLLRMHICERISIDVMATSYGVHRVTICRWLDQARHAIASHTRAHLSTTLRLSDSEVASVLRAAHSQFDLSVERVLAGDPPTSRGVG